MTRNEAYATFVIKLGTVVFILCIRRFCEVGCNANIYFFCLQIHINGSHYTDFIHRIPYERVSYFSVDGDVTVNSIEYSGGHGYGHGHSGGHMPMPIPVPMVYPGAPGYVPLPPPGPHGYYPCLLYTSRCV